MHIGVAKNAFFRRRRSDLATAPLPIVRHDGDHFKIVRAREGKITLVVCRNTHDGSSSVITHDVVRNVHGNELVGERMSDTRPKCYSSKSCRRSVLRRNGLAQVPPHIDLALGRDQIG